MPFEAIIVSLEYNASAQLQGLWRILCGVSCDDARYKFDHL